MPRCFAPGPSQSGLAWSRLLDGETLQFERVTAASFRARDTATGSLWDVRGRAVPGPLEGRQLEWVTSFVTQWYRWAEYHPTTALYGTAERWAQVEARPLGDYDWY